MEITPETNEGGEKTLGLRNIPWGLIKAYLANLIKIKLLHNDNVSPASCGFYVTQACNFNCGYCDVRDNEAQGQLGTEDMKTVLKKIRASVPSITFSGGEPLLREDIVEILEEAKKLGFNPINLFTNLSLLDEKPEVLDDINMLSTSLDCLDADSYDKITRVPGSTDKIKGNIIKFAKLQKEKGFILNVNCVIGPHNLSKVKELAEFVLNTGATLSVGPLISRDGQPHKFLIDNPEYKEVMDYIIALKKAGRPILSSLRFLETVRDFKEFKCHPFLIPRVLPNGELLYPCELLRTRTANILEGGSFDEIVKLLREGCPPCEKSCYLGCYVEPSLVAENPLDLIKETKLYRKAGILS